MSLSMTFCQKSIDCTNLTILLQIDNINVKKRIVLTASLTARTEILRGDPDCDIYFCRRANFPLGVRGTMPSLIVLGT